MGSCPSIVVVLGVNFISEENLEGNFCAQVNVQNEEMKTLMKGEISKLFSPFWISASKFCIGFVVVFQILELHPNMDLHPNFGPVVAAPKSRKCCPKIWAAFLDIWAAFLGICVQSWFCSCIGLV